MSGVSSLSAREMTSSTLCSPLGKDNLGLKPHSQFFLPQIIPCLWPNCSKALHPDEVLDHWRNGHGVNPSEKLACPFLDCDFETRVYHAYRIHCVHAHSPDPATLPGVDSAPLKRRRLAEDEDDPPQWSSKFSTTSSGNNELRRCTPERPDSGLLPNNTMRCVIPKCRSIFAIDHIEIHFHRTHHVDLTCPFVCPTCSSPFPTIESLKHHVREHQEGPDGLAKPSSRLLPASLSRYGKPGQAHLSTLAELRRSATETRSSSKKKPRTQARTPPAPGSRLPHRTPINHPTPIPQTPPLPAVPIPLTTDRTLTPATVPAPLAPNVSTPPTYERKRKCKHTFLDSTPSPRADLLKRLEVDFSELQGSSGSFWSRLTVGQCPHFGDGQYSYLDQPHRDCVERLWEEWDVYFAPHEDPNCVLLKEGHRNS